jgi:hypothetical protein
MLTDSTWQSMTCYRCSKFKRLNLTAILEKESNLPDKNGAFIVSISLLAGPTGKATK